MSRTFDIYTSLTYIAAMQFIYTKHYLKQARRIFSNELERLAIEDEIGSNPERWPVIPGSAAYAKLDPP